jgi:hypothetical protein
MNFGYTLKGIADIGKFIQVSKGIYKVEAENCFSKAVKPAMQKNYCPTKIQLDIMSLSS